MIPCAHVFGQNRSARAWMNTTKHARWLLSCFIWSTTCTRHGVTNGTKPCHTNKWMFYKTTKGHGTTKTRKLKRLLHIRLIEFTPYIRTSMEQRSNTSTIELSWATTIHDALHRESYAWRSCPAKNCLILCKSSFLTASGTVWRPWGVISATNSSTVTFSNPRLRTISLQFCLSWSRHPHSTSLNLRGMNKVNLLQRPTTRLLVIINSNEFHNINNINIQ